MSDLKHRVRPDWHHILEEILARAKALGRRAVIAFDLDSTIFDNRPRQARIVREFGAAHRLPELARCQPAHFTDGWDMRAAFRNCGLSAEAAEKVYPDARRFWAARFFTSAYCVDDDMVEGAVAFVRRALDTGARVAYVTGRHEEMRAGTEQAMRRHGFPLPDGDRVLLIMKPAFETHDDDFKREAHARIGELGELVAAFDNEPTHANDYRLKFPDATVIHLATDHSGRKVELLDGIVSVPHFRYP